MCVCVCVCVCVERYCALVLCLWLLVSSSQRILLFILAQNPHKRLACKIT